MPALQDQPGRSCDRRKCWSGAIHRFGWLVSTFSSYNLRSNVMRQEKRTDLNSRERASSAYEKLQRTGRKRDLTQRYSDASLLRSEFETMCDLAEGRIQVLVYSCRLCSKASLNVHEHDTVR